jgi:hypothetical protein
MVVRSVSGLATRLCCRFIIQGGTKMSNDQKKLTLNQETLRKLNRDELAKVAGGFAFSKNNSYCCPTFTCVAPGRNE